MKSERQRVPMSQLDDQSKRIIWRNQQARMLETYGKLKFLFEGATFGRDIDLRQFTGRLRTQIVDKRFQYLPLCIFTTEPHLLFYVEGTSQAILYDHIPITDANVYVVADFDYIVDYTALCRRLCRSTDMTFEASHAHICENTRLFLNDVVSTNDPQLRELYADKISHYEKYKARK